MLFFRKKNSPIIIGGFYRSGTTLLRRLMDSHSHIYCSPEVKFWRDLHNQYHNDPYAHIRFFNTAKSMGLDDSFVRKTFGSAYISLLDKGAQLKGKKRWADKNPENLLFLNEWRELLNGKMQFVFLIRNPLDTLASLKEAAFDKTLPLEFDKKVEVFADYLRGGISFLQQYPAQSYLLTYEDLVLSPELTLKKLMSWLGHSYEPDVLNDFWRPERGVGIEDPKVASTKVVHSASVNRWQTELSQREIKLTREKLSPYFCSLGHNYFN